MRPFLTVSLLLLGALALSQTRPGGQGVPYWMVTDSAFARLVILDSTGVPAAHPSRTMLFQGVGDTLYYIMPGGTVIKVGGAVGGGTGDSAKVAWRAYRDSSNQSIVNLKMFLDSLSARMRAVRYDGDADDSVDRAQVAAWSSWAYQAQRDSSGRSLVNNKTLIDSLNARVRAIDSLTWLQSRSSNQASYLDINRRATFSKSGAGIFYDSLRIHPGTNITLDNSGNAVTINATSTGGDAKFFLATSTQNITAASQAITLTDGYVVKQLTSDNNYTLTAEPTIAAGRNGQWASLHNLGQYTITLQDINSKAGSLLRLTSSTLGIGPGGSVSLLYDSINGVWMQATPYISILSFTPSISAFTVDGTSAGTREVAASGTEAGPAFAVSYVGAPTHSSIRILDTVGTGYIPYFALNAPYTSGTGGTFQKRRVVGAVTTFQDSAYVSGSSVKRNATITYQNTRYYGPDTSVLSMTSAELTAASKTKDFGTSRTGTWSLTVGASNYLWFAHRAALGTTTLYLKVGSEAAGFLTNATAFSHTNASGFVENYFVARSIKGNFGSVTFTVSTIFDASSNRIWIGPSTSTTVLDSTATRALDDAATGSSRLSNSYVYANYTVTTGAGEYIMFAYPRRLGDTPYFFNNNNQVQFVLVGNNTNMSNDYSYVEEYRYWRSQQTNLGAVTIEVRSTP